MVKTVSPSNTELTSGQTAKILELFSAGLRKSGLQNEAVQHVMTEQGPALVAELIAVVRTRVEAVSALVVRSWTSDRTRTSEQVIKETGRRQYVDANVVKTMPRGTGSHGQTTFFKLDLSKRGGYISCADLGKEFALRALLPEYPDHLADINKADPVFADTHPNATQWQDADGNYCYAIFGRWVGERFVSVNRFGNDWRGSYWFAGRPQE